MHENDIMEELSKNFIKIIAHKSGYFCLDGKDYGTDLHFARPKKTTRNGKTRYLKTGRQVDFQLKSVLEKYITQNTTHISYDLKVKNYNDLIQRKQDYDKGEDDFPLILIVFVFPNNPKDWVEVSEQELILRKCAYWYYPDASANFSDNDTTQVIHIPKTNRIDLNFLDNLFEQFK